LSPDGGQTFLTATGFTYDLSQVGTFDVHLPGGSGLVYQVNALTGQTVDIHDRLGNQVVYDSNDFRAQRQDANGNYQDAYRTDGTQELVPFVRDGLNRITAITDLRGHSLLYTYDANGNLLTVTDRTGQMTAQYGYNGPVAHFLTSVTDATGTQTLQAQYDSTTNRVNKLTDASGNSTSLGYTVAAPGASISSNPSERALQTTTRSFIDPITGATTTSTTTQALDASGNVIRNVDAAGLTTTTAPNAQNLPTTVTRFAGTLNLVTTTTYDPASLQPISIVSPTTTETISYNAATGEPAIIMNGVGDSTQSSYDSTSGALLGITSAIGASISFAYDHSGELTSATRAGVSSMFTYDGSGLQTSATDDLGNKVVNSYDDNGNKFGTSRVWTDPTNGTNTTLTTSTVYDGNDRVIQTTGEDGLTTKKVFDGRGNAFQSIDVHGNITSSIYDARNKAVEVDLPDGTVMRTLYDSGGRAVYSSDPFVAGTTDFSQVRGTESLYDNAGRITDLKRVVGVHVIITVDPRTGIGTASFDTTSNVTTLSDTQPFYRASDGQIDHIIEPTGDYTYPQYDAYGRQTGTVVGNAPLTFPLTTAELSSVLEYASTTHFDAAGRATSEIDASAQTTEPPNNRFQEFS
jgi:YD repeat-containing protein